jgi:hypothetical protein
MSADVLSFEVATRVMRGPAAEADRKATIRERWREARTRAFHGIVHEADVGLFGIPALMECRGARVANHQLVVLPAPRAKATS